MKTLVVVWALMLSTSLGVAQDTVRTSRRADRLTTPRRDTVRYLTDSTLVFRRDSIRWVPASIRFARDSVLWVIPKDSVRWLPHLAEARHTRLDTARVRWLPPLEAERTVASAISIQNGNSSFEEYLFPPELVMQHQARLRLTEQQRDAIVAEINKLQATAVQAQWRVGDESEKLAELLRRETVSEAEALAQAERLVAQETTVKRAQLSMLIRIRNVLTPEQREFLHFRRKSPKD